MTPARHSDWTSGWTRRAWLTRQTRMVAQLAALHVAISPGGGSVPSLLSGRRRTRPPATALVDRLDPGSFQPVAQHAVDAARAAGAQYADARLTRTVRHDYSFYSNFVGDAELLGVGVRVVVDGYWGFAASPFWTLDDVTRLAQDAVGQAKANARGGTRRMVEFTPIPAARGTWATPIRMDPFTTPMEEKIDFMAYWTQCAEKAGLRLNTNNSEIHFVRQERVVATSDGALFTQTVYESGGTIYVELEADKQTKEGGSNKVRGIVDAGKGWELFLDAKIPEQYPALLEEIRAGAAIGGKLGRVGRYTLVCDGATMAALVDATVGVATQLDRAMGYEANAGGTSFLDDPLAMVGHFPVASPLVTVTSNRSAPAQLATVKWDDEGVIPVETTLIKEGVLTNFQTTREQAAWLAPYYHQQGMAVHSNGCAGADSALSITMQHMPNLAMAPNAADVHVADLVADVKDGLLIEQGKASADFQGRNGLLLSGNSGTMREIKNGKLGKYVMGNVIQFNTLDLWKHVIAVGGAATQGGYDAPAGDIKGQPEQGTSYSVRAVAATMTNQAFINPQSKA